MNGLMIKDKDGKLTKLNEDDDFAGAQREFVKHIEFQHNTGRPIRIIVLKGRQVGLSTATEAFLFLWCFFFPGANVMVMSQDRPRSEKLFEMTKLMWDTWVFRTLFSTDRSSVRRLSWAETLSNFQVESAKAKEVGRGGTLQAVHMSEVAFWEDQGLAASLYQAIPNRHGTAIILESTAHGVGGYFYDEWMKAIKGESDFAPLFFPWWKHKEYTIRDTTLRSSELSPNEKALIRDFDLTLGQLAWRRRKIKELNDDEDKFKEEYPCHWMEAFLATGDNVFPLEALAECYLPVGDMNWDGKPVGMTRGNLINDNGKITFHRDHSGLLKVYKRPDPAKRMQYVVAADPSRTTYGDPACIQVLNRTTWEQVAVWRGHAIDGDLAELMTMLGYWYNNATLNLEFQGGGAGVLAIIKHMRYPLIWKWKRPDMPMHKLGTAYGWVTNVMSKQWGIGSLQHYLTKRQLKLHDEVTVGEMMEYTLLDGVEMGPASASGHDDTVMALMIAWMTNQESDPPDLSRIYNVDVQGGTQVPAMSSANGYSDSEFREIE